MRVFVIGRWEVGEELEEERVVLQGYDWLLFNFCFVIILF